MSSKSRVNISEEKALKVISVFSKQQMILGLPSHVFGLGSMLTVVVFTMLSKVMAVIFALVYFQIMYSIHENDPKGFDIWRNVLVRKKMGWCSARVRATRLVVLRKTGAKCD